MHDKHYNIEEPYDAKVSSTVLEPSREGRPSLLRQPRVCHAHVGQGCTTTGSAHAYNQILCMHYGFCLIYKPRRFVDQTKSILKMDFVFFLEQVYAVGDFVYTVSVWIG